MSIAPPPRAVPRSLPAMRAPSEPPLGPRIVKSPPTAISIGPPASSAPPERISLSRSITRFPPTAIRTEQGSPPDVLAHVIVPPGVSVRFPPTVKMPLAWRSASRGEPSSFSIDSAFAIVTFAVAKRRLLNRSATQSIAIPTRTQRRQCLRNLVMIEGHCGGETAPRKLDDGGGDFGPRPPGKPYFPAVLPSSMVRREPPGRLLRFSIIPSGQRISRASILVASPRPKVSVSSGAER